MLAKIHTLKGTSFSILRLKSNLFSLLVMLVFSHLHSQFNSAADSRHEESIVFIKKKHIIIELFQINQANDFNYKLKNVKVDII